MLRIVPTTLEHCEAFFPAPVPYRIRGLTAIDDDGTVIGIGGLAMLPEGAIAVFLEASEENAKKYPVTLYKAAQQVLSLAQNIGFMSLVTRADQRREAAARFLERVGFQPAGEVDGEVVWQWRQSA